jgi:Protein NO VEIN, C-terminal
MDAVMAHESALGRQVFDVHEKNLGYDITSLDLTSGELRLIEVKGLAGATGIIRLTPNEKRVAEARRDCYWLYVEPLAEPG